MARTGRFSGLVVGLFALTALTVTTAGAWHTVTFLWATTGTAPNLLSGVALRGALWFDLGVLGSLLCHEAGHLWAYRRHVIGASGPYFVPFLPLSVTGTLGAFLRPLRRCETRRAMVEVGASGPVAGFLWALLCALIGLQWSIVTPLMQTNLIRFGSPLIFRLVKPGHLTLHPLAAGAWIGCLVTFVNLLPFEHFDGALILRGLWPKLGRLVSLAMFGVGLFMFGAWNPHGMTWAFAWGVAILGVLVSGGLQADPGDEEPLPWSTRLLAVAAGICLVLTWTSL